MIFFLLSFNVEVSIFAGLGLGNLFLKGSLEGSFIGFIQSMKITKRGKKTNICAVCDSSSIHSIFMFVHLFNDVKFKLLLTMCIETLNYIAEDSYYCLFKFCTYDFLWWNSFEGHQIMFGSFMFSFISKEPLFTPDHHFMTIRLPQDSQHQTSRLLHNSHSKRISRWAFISLDFIYSCLTLV